jgi:hypothetical protein
VHDGIDDSLPNDLDRVVVAVAAPEPDHMGLARHVSDHRLHNSLDHDRDRAVKGLVVEEPDALGSRVTRDDTRDDDERDVELREELLRVGAETLEDDEVSGIPEDARLPLPNTGHQANHHAMVQILGRGVGGGLAIIQRLGVIGEELGHVVLTEPPVAIARPDERPTAGPPGCDEARLGRDVHLGDVGPDDRAPVDVLDADLAPDRRSQVIRTHACQTVADRERVEPVGGSEAGPLLQTENDRPSLAVAEGAQRLAQALRAASTALQPRNITADEGKLWARRQEAGTEKRPDLRRCKPGRAETVGFEPTEGLLLHILSRDAH